MYKGRSIKRDSCEVRIKIKKKRGHDLKQDLDLDSFIAGYKGMGIQGSVFSKAIEIINKMITWKLEDEEEFDEDNLKKFHYRKCKKYLGFSSSMASTGCRDIIKYICEHRMVDVIVTTTGGVEEDLIKCFGDYYIGNFNDIEDGDLIKEGLERQGNVLVPKGIQEKFEEWILKIFKEIHAEQDHEKFKYASPLSIIKKLGEKIGDEKSILYQCWKNDIPVFCPSFTDGLIGEILYRYNKQHPGFVIDTANDVMLMNNSTLFTTKTGAIILGGGIIKHHILNANLFRNGANYSVSEIKF